jgi:hypothetical protein
MSSSFNGTSPQGLFRVPNAMEIHTTPRTNSQSASVVPVNGLCGIVDQDVDPTDASSLSHRPGIGNTRWGHPLTNNFSAAINALGSYWL